MKSILVSLLCMLSYISHAQSQPLMSQKSLSTYRLIEAIKPDRIGHFSIFNGPGLSGSSANRFNTDGSISENSLSSWHQVSFQYQLNDNYRFVVNPRFVLDYNNPTENNGKPRAEWVNPVFGINGTWYKRGNLTFSGSINSIFLNLEEEAREEQLIANPGGFQAVNYTVSSSLSVGTWLWGRYNIRLNADEYTRAPVFVAPYLVYSVNDQLSLQPFYQYNGALDEYTSQVDTDDTFNLLMSYNITKKLSIQPILTVSRDTDFALSQGNLNLWLAGVF